MGDAIVTGSRLATFFILLHPPVFVVPLSTSAFEIHVGAAAACFLQHEKLL